MDVIPQIWNYFTPHFTFYTTSRSLKTFFLILFINIKLGVKKKKLRGQMCRFGDDKSPLAIAN